jgi:hypothetical protein
MFGFIKKRKASLKKKYDDYREWHKEYSLKPSEYNTEGIPPIVVEGHTYRRLKLVPDCGPTKRVYRALRDGDTEKYYAMKFVDKTSREPEIYEGIRREGGNKHLLAYYGCGEYEGKKCLVLEYLDDTKNMEFLVAFRKWPVELEDQYQAGLRFLEKFKVRPNEKTEGKNVFVARGNVVKILGFDNVPLPITKGCLVDAQKA